MSLWIAVLAASAAGALVAGLAFLLLHFSARKNEEARRLQEREDLRAVMELAVSRLETDRARQGADLSGQRQAVESAVSELSARLKEYETLMRRFEEDRERKFGSLEEGLRAASSTTEKLAAATEGLKSLLSNSRARGQWGERMASDILNACGLIENVQYLKNRAQEGSATRPDYTFLLPGGQKFHMDVKFPLDNYLRMASAAGEEERARCKAEFIRDVKDRIKEIQRRDYINPAEGTLDYVLLFIPNEQVYGFVHEAIPGLIDDTLRQKVVLCSPFTLYAVLAVVRQAFDNFHFAQATQEVLKLVTNFSAAYDKFKERFAGLGEQLSKTSQLYEDITGTSYRRLDAAVAKMDKARRSEVMEGQVPAPLVDE